MGKKASGNGKATATKAKAKAGPKASIQKNRGSPPKTPRKQPCNKDNGTASLGVQLDERAKDDKVKRFGIATSEGMRNLFGKHVQPKSHAPEDLADARHDDEPMHISLQSHADPTLPGQHDSHQHDDQHSATGSHADGVLPEPKPVAETGDAGATTSSSTSSSLAACAHPNAQGEPEHTSEWLTTRETTAEAAAVLQVVHGAVTAEGEAKHVLELQVPVPEDEDIIMQVQDRVEPATVTRGLSDDVAVQGMLQGHDVSQAAPVTVVPSKSEDLASEPTLVEDTPPGTPRSQSHVDSLCERRKRLLTLFQWPERMVGTALLMQQSTFEYQRAYTQSLKARLASMSISTSFSGIDSPSTALAMLGAGLLRSLGETVSTETLPAIQNLWAVEWAACAQQELMVHPAGPNCLFSDINEFWLPGVADRLAARRFRELHVEFW